MSDGTDDPHAALLTDPDLGPLVERYGELELGCEEEPFERLVISVVNQLVSTAAARTIRERLFEAVTVTPAGILAADDERLREAGLSPQKVAAIDRLAERFVAGDLDVQALQAREDAAIVETLTATPGIGDWTAKMALLFVFEREDVFPVEDLAVRRGMERLYGECSRAEMCELAERWRPYRSYAALYLWHHYEDGATEVGVTE